MRLKIGSIVKIEYRTDYIRGGHQTGILLAEPTFCLGSTDEFDWYRILYLTPVESSKSTEPLDWLGVGISRLWYAPTTLNYFEVEVIEEGTGAELIIGGIGLDTTY